MKKIRRQVINKQTKRLLTSALLLTLALVALSTVTAVSASNSTIYISNSNGNDEWDGHYAEWIIDTLSGPKKSIKNATEIVTEGGTVKIADGTYTGEKNTNIIIDKNMTIQGQSKNGTIINGTTSARIFQIQNGANITIANLTLANGNAFVGGAIYNTGTLAVNNCTFTDNIARDDGGAIYNTGTLNVNGCSFTGNNANYGGAIYNFGSTLNINNTNFTNNTANYHGGAINNFIGTLSVNNCIFINNEIIGTYPSLGGAIYNSNTLMVNSSTFTGNQASDGGAVYNDNTLNVNNCIFTGNQASDGGAIFNGHYGVLTVKNSTFTNNTAINNGGAIFAYENLTVSDGKFHGNKADSNGGAIFIEGNSSITSTVSSSIFTGNTAEGEGGAIYNAFSNLAITGCNFDHNTAGSDGGAIYCWIGYETTSQTVIRYSRFIGNTVENVLQDVTIYEGVLDARYNWWGSNDGPQSGRIASRGNHVIQNGVSYAPWLILSINAAPSTISPGENSTITADVYTDSTGGDHSADAAQFFSGLQVTFKTDLGNLGSKEITAPFILGSATATLRGDEGPGLATLTAADSQTVQTLVNIQQESDPEEPTDPSDPEDPNPADPEEPTDPSDPEDPTEPEDPNPLEPEDPNDPLEPADPEDPTESEDPSDLENPTNPLNPVNPDEADDPVDQPENSTTMANAVNKTVEMQPTGVPLAWLVLAILVLFGGLITSKK